MSSPPSGPDSRDTATTSSADVVSPEDYDDFDDSHLPPQQVIANRIRQGRRHMLCEEYNLAVDAFQEAVELSVSLYPQGELAPECGEPFYLYGTALLSAARAESQAFEGPSGAGEDGGEDSDDDAADAEQETTHLRALSEETGAASGAAAHGSSGESAKQNKGKGKAKAETATDDEASHATGAPEEESRDGEREEAEGAEEDENVDNLQLAWESLECARVIFSTQNTTKAKLSLASVYARLGEHGIESENLNQALEDFQQSYRIRVDHLAPHDRSIAEILFSMSLAYQSGKRFEDAAACLNEALDVIQKRLDWLRSGSAIGDSMIAALDSKECASSSSSSSSSSSAPAAEVSSMTSPPLTSQKEVDAEIEDLNQLIPEINAKIAEIKEEKDAVQSGQFEMIHKLLPKSNALDDIDVPTPASIAATVLASITSGSSLLSSSSSASASPSGQAPAVNTLQVRKKVQPTLVSSATSASSSSSSSSSSASTLSATGDGAAASSLAQKRPANERAESPDASEAPKKARLG